jgi:Tellurite resistance protein TerB.
MDRLKTGESREKATFLATLGFAAKLDGVTQDELDFIDEIAEDFQASKDELDAAKKDRDEEAVLALLPNITNEKTKKQLLRELFFLGYADGNLSDNEVIFLSKVGNKLGIDDETIERISEWVIRGIEWEEEGQELF